MRKPKKPFGQSNIYERKKKKVENKGLGGANKQHQLLLEKHWVVGVRGQKEDGKCQDIKKKYFNFFRCYFWGEGKYGEAIPM